MLLIMPTIWFTSGDHNLGIIHCLNNRFLVGFVNLYSMRTKGYSSAQSSSSLDRDSDSSYLSKVDDNSTYLVKEIMQEEQKELP